MQTTCRPSSVTMPCRARVRARFVPRNASYRGNPAPAPLEGPLDGKGSLLGAQEQGNGPAAAHRKRNSDDGCPERSLVESDVPPALADVRNREPPQLIVCQ